MAKPRKKYIDYLVYLVARVVDMLLELSVDVGLCYRAARVAGDLMYRFDRRHREISRRHLHLSFPDWPEDRIARVTHESLRGFFYMGLEVLMTPRLIRAESWHRHIVLKDYDRIARLLIQHPRGLVTLTGHFGNWEIASYVTATIGFPSFAVARPIDNPYLNEYIMGVREKAGQTIIFKKGATQQVQDVLDRNDIISFVADQDAGRKGLFVNFFGRQASTYKSIALLAMQYNIPVILMCCRRLDLGFHFEIWPQRVIYPHEWADRKDPLRWITQEYTTALEEAIRAYPEQYFWVHRRWKHRPKGQESTPDGVA